MSSAIAALVNDEGNVTAGPAPVVRGGAAGGATSGTVTFVIKNSGAEVHNFDINGVHSGALLSPGATETWVVKLPAGQYLYTCDVPFHVDRGMTGALQVTP